MSAPAAARAHRAKHGATDEAEDWLCQARFVAREGLPAVAMMVNDLEDAADLAAEEVLQEYASALRTGGDPHQLSAHTAKLVTAARRLIDAHRAGIVASGWAE